MSFIDANKYKNKIQMYLILTIIMLYTLIGSNSAIT